MKRYILEYKEDMGFSFDTHREEFDSTADAFSTALVRCGDGYEWIYVHFYGKRKRKPIASYQVYWYYGDPCPSIERAEV